MWRRSTTGRDAYGNCGPNMVGPYSVVFKDARTSQMEAMCLRHYAGPLAPVLMPEAPVNEDDLAARSEREVGSSRQVLPVQSVALAHRMHEPPHHHLGLGVLPLVGLHHLAGGGGDVGEGRDAHWSKRLMPYLLIKKT